MINITPKIKALSAKERTVLYFLALKEDDYLREPKKKLLETCKISDREFEKIISKLDKEGLIYKFGYYSYRVEIQTFYRIGVIEYMLEKQPELEPMFIDIYSSSSDVIRQLKILASAIQGVPYITTYKYDTDVVNRLCEYYDRPWFPNLVRYLKAADYIELVSLVMRNRTLMDHLIDREALERLCSATGQVIATVQQVADMRTYYLYTAYGDPLPDKIPTTRGPMTLAAAGIQRTIQGDYEGAIEAFGQAFKILNRDRSLKNCFIELYAQYYLVMAYYRINDAAAQKKLQVFLNKKDANDYYSLIPARIIARVAHDNNKLLAPWSIKDMLQRTFDGEQMHAIYKFGYLFDQYFHTGFSKTLLETPNYALLRLEMVDVLGVDQKQREAITKVYGGEPALTSIHRKENWELVIDEVIKTVDQVSPQLDGSTLPTLANTSRIIYVNTYDDYFEPRYQTVLKSGAWSKPRKVTGEKYFSGSLDYLDDTDRMIVNLMKPEPYSYSQHCRAYKIMPFLVGSDRVFTYDSSYNELQSQIQIIEGTPHIKLAKDKSGDYKVTSNIKIDHLNNMSKGMVTLRTNQVTFTVIPVSDSQRRVMEILLRDPVFPAKAEPLLMKLLTRLDGVVEIQSPLLDKSAVKTVDGSGLIVLKVKPMSGMLYEVSILSKPMEHGTVYLLPATGKAVYYDTVDGVNMRVKRDMAAESASYHEVIDVIDSPEYPMGDGDYTVILDIEPLLALMDFSRQNPERFVMEWAEGKGLSLRAPLSQGSWNVGLKSQNGWFDIEGEVRVDEHTVIKMSELIDIIAREKGRFVRLGTNDYIEIDRKLRRQLERIEALAVHNRNKLQVSAFNAALLDQSVLDGEIHISHDDKLTELQERIRQSEEVTPKVPSTLQATLRPYQVEGYQWMMRLAEWGAGACLADDMGLGKTVQTIAFLLAKAKEGPALIVAPASVVPNWRNELERFAPSLHVEILNRADDREATIKGARKGAVVVTTYGLLNTMEEALSKKKWTTVCLDEAHTIKNRDTKMSQAAMKLQAVYRIALTGTPIQNHLGELWNLFRFLNEGLLGPFDSFRQKFVNPIAQNNDKERRRALQRIIKPFMLRRTKSEVVDELPDKTDIYMPVELSEEEMAMYEALRQKAVKALEEATTLDVSTLAEITKLRQAACAPALIDRDWTGSNSKVQSFLELVRDFKGDGNKMLVFSQFTSFLEIVRKALDAEGEKYLYLDGSTPMKQRERLVEEFQHGECPLFLISLKAGGLGLNLTGANYVVHLDPWWNPAIEQQATDRAYRIGQHRNVTVYHLLSKGTIEEKIRRLHQTKRDLADSLLEGTDMAGRLTIADILALVNS